MKSIVYVHYQRRERDGSFVHTRMFSREFGALCAERGIAFNVIAPDIIDSDQVPIPTWGRRLMTQVSRFFLSDIKCILVQCKNMLRERKQLQALSADMVLTRYNLNTLSIIWAARSLKIPVLLEINSPDDEYWGIRFYRLPGMKYFFSDTRALTLADGGFAVSEALASSLRHELKEEKPVYSIPNGVCIEQFDPELSGRAIRKLYGIGQGKIVLGFVGSFAPWHGVDMLFEAFIALREKGLPVHLLLVGQIREDLTWREQAESEALREHVTLAGYVPQTEINEYLAAMDISVLANSAWYCSPLKVFEYMAMAKAIVAVGTEPVSEMLEHNKEALLFEQGSLRAMTAALELAASDESLRKRLGQAARQRVAQEYTWTDNARRVFGLMEDVLDQRTNK